MLTMKQRSKAKDKVKYSQLNDKNSDDSGEEKELLVVTKKPFRQVQTIDKPIEEGDTLQAISIKYHCPISELKRINNIHKENEIFAKTTIKVPIRPISFALAAVHSSGNSSPHNDINGTSSTVDIETLQDKLIENFFNLPRAANHKAEEEEVKQIIFNSNLKSTEKVLDAVSETIPQVNEGIHLLPKQTELNESIYSNFSCSGVDGDISVKALIVLFVILIVVVPLVYVFYVAEHPEYYHHHEHAAHVHSR